MNQLLQTPHFTLEHDITQRLIRLTRTELAFNSGADVDAAYASLIAKVETIDRTQFSLLSDMRKGPPGTERAGIRDYRNRGQRRLFDQRQCGQGQLRIL